MAKLRGHHLICLQFFVGKGYSPKFVKNTFRVLRNAKKIRVISGIDEVCKACPNLIEGRCPEEKVKELDRLAIFLLSINVGSVVNWDEIERRLPRIIPIWVRKACKKCKWWRVCKVEILKFKCQLHGKHG